MLTIHIRVSLHKIMWSQQQYVLQAAYIKKDDDDDSNEVNDGNNPIAVCSTGYRKQYTIGDSFFNRPSMYILGSSFFNRLLSIWR